MAMSTVRRGSIWVTLTGNVHAWFERDKARRAAWSAPGVKNVDDRLAVVP
jgi:osmotically-inducible protein OsmY